MSNYSITVYSLPVCPNCDATKKFLDKHGLSYEAVDLTVDPAARAAVKAEGFTTAPVVKVTVDGEQRSWGGMSKPDLDWLVNVAVN